MMRYLDSTGFNEAERMWQENMQLKETIRSREREIMDKEELLRNVHKTYITGLLSTVSQPEGYIAKDKGVDKEELDSLISHFYAGHGETFGHEESFIKVEDIPF